MKPSEQKANPLPKKFPHGMEKLTTAQTDFPGKDKLHNFRATRLGEFSLIGRLFILFGFLKIAGVEVRWCNFFHGRNYELLMAKTGWATFWAILSQTHLVTLFATFIIKFSKRDCFEWTWAVGFF
jgi:hypothetical protein